MTDIHAHEIMHMMLETDGGFSRESLAQAIIERFGTDARFHTCSANGMDVQCGDRFPREPWQVRSPR